VLCAPHGLVQQPLNVRTALLALNRCLVRTRQRDGGHPNICRIPNQTGDKPSTPEDTTTQIHRDASWGIRLIKRTQQGYQELVSSGWYKVGLHIAPQRRRGIRALGLGAAHWEPQAHIAHVERRYTWGPGDCSVSLHCWEVGVWLHCARCMHTGQHSPDAKPCD
jgi:hypothetical protein